MLQEGLEGNSHVLVNVLLTQLIAELGNALLLIQLIHLLLL
jgi:hypothetical protein